MASEYSWTIPIIIKLTLNQLNTFVTRITERNKQKCITEALVMRMAIIGAMSKEGGREFDKFVDRLSSEIDTVQKPIKPVKPVDLTNLGFANVTKKR